MKRITSLVCALLLVPSFAMAQPKTPDDWYKAGENQYNLGNFDEAVKAFKQGFALETVDSKKSAYLYNIAQSYRQNKDCSNAQFFYKRFLSLREADTAKPLSEKTRKDVEDRIRELEECARQQEAIRNRPPEGIKPGGSEPTQPDATKPDVTKPGPTQVGVAGGNGDGNGDGDGDDEDGVTARVETTPMVISARVAGGGAKVSMGDATVPLQGTFALLAGYPIPVSPRLTLEVGPAFTYTPVPFDSMRTATKGTVSLIGAVANASARYTVAPKIAIRGDVGLGMLFMGGASKSPFTSGAETTGALAMFHVRVGVSADYEITPNLIATLPLAFSYSPAKDGLAEDISSITAFDFMVGLGYRM
ncbi:MAG: hypothetical protein H0X17_14285 [Deltaproteobacteria bacterium]|nr:hypothetical protein [Deltaproteobacteria bacterium]